MTNMINQIGNLETIILKQMGWLDKIFKKNKDGEISRREFLKGSGKLAGIAAATQIPSIMTPKRAKASRSIANPGFYPANTGDPNQNKTVWVSSGKGSIVNGVNFENKIELPTILQSLIEKPIMEKIPGIPPGIHLAGKIYERAWLVRDNPEKLVKFIPEFDYANEPAAYLIAGYIYKNPQELATAKQFGNLPKNHAMTHWAKEIGMYLNKYLRRENVRNSQIEDPAHQAMILASGGQSINDMTRNGVNLDKITNVKILIWATTWLINMYDEEKNYSNKYYSNIEMKIRTKKSNLRIRGNNKNYYYDDKGGFFI